MLNIKKFKTKDDYQLIFDNGEQQLCVYNNGTLDLFITIYSEPNEVGEKTFEITKENYFVYTVFLELYNKIKNCGAFSQLNFEANDRLRTTGVYDKLFCDGIVKWHSDDFLFDEASVMNIEAKDESIIFTFTRSNDYEQIKTFGSRIRNNGGRYSYFNIPFMEAYLELLKYDPDNHQVHVEEYMYLKRLKNNK